MAHAQMEFAPGAAPRSLVRTLPGLGLTAAIAAAAFALARFTPLGVLSPLILAILIGMGLGNLGPKPGAVAALRPGVAFSLRRLLRTGIVLLGLQLTLGQVGEIGVHGVAIVAGCLLCTFAFTTWLGARLGVDARLTQLIAAGTSICGASAVIATNTVTRAREEDVAYAVACVTVFGSLSMLLLPLAGSALDLGPQAYGLWVGGTVHEVAQVVAAAFQQGEAAGHFGTVAKLTRVLMLAPVVLALGLWARRGVAADGGTGAGQGGAPLPWFVLGFAAMVGLNSTGIVPDALRPWTGAATQGLLAMALAAMGLETDLRKLVARGLRPALLGAASWIFILCLGLALVALAGAWS